jgi:glycosyltransferase involved in cell wall biosynthesis
VIADNLSTGPRDPNPIPFSVAVAIPCHNEGPAIAAVLAEWRAALPSADLVVFDNNSTDGTGAIARDAGARVIDVPDQGKGFAVRAIFATLDAHDAIVMIDGDGTYPASAVGPLLEPIITGEADMAVGARRPVAGAGAMSPVRGLGNGLIRLAFAVLIGRGHDDLLSGYRVFSGPFARSFRPRSEGFEIETELACAAVARRLRVVTVEVPYHPRFAGTQSKLRAVRDGLRILRTIVRQSIRLRPWRPLALLGGLVALVLMACAIVM